MEVGSVGIVVVFDVMVCSLCFGLFWWIEMVDCDCRETDCVLFDDGCWYGGRW